MVNVAPYALGGKPAPSYCGFDMEEPSGAMDAPPQQTECVVLAREDELVPGASMTISTCEGAPHRLQHLLATRGLGWRPVTSLEVGRLHSDQRGCAAIWLWPPPLTWKAKASWSCNFLLITLICSFYVCSLVFHDPMLTTARLKLACSWYHIPQFALQPCPLLLKPKGTSEKWQVYFIYVSSQSLMKECVEKHSLFKTPILFLCIEVFSSCTDICLPKGGGAMLSPLSKGTEGTS